MMPGRTACTTTRQRALGLVLLGSSFAIQMVPPILQRWARILGTSEGNAMAAIAVIYLALLAAVMVKGRAR